MKDELRALNPINQKRKWTEQGASSESVNQKNPALAPPKSHLTGQAEPVGSMEEPTTPLLNVEWELINTSGVVARNTSLLPVLEG